MAYRKLVKLKKRVIVINTLVFTLYFMQKWHEQKCNLNIITPLSSKQRSNKPSMLGFKPFLVVEGKRPFPRLEKMGGIREVILTTSPSPSWEPMNSHGLPAACNKGSVSHIRRVLSMEASSTTELIEVVPTMC